MRAHQRHAGHSIDDLQNCGRSHPALQQRVMTMMMGEEDNEIREGKILDGNGDCTAGRISAGNAAKLV